MSINSIPVILGEDTVTLVAASPGKALSLVRALATDDPEEFEAATGALLAYLWPDNSVSGYPDLWPRYSNTDIHAAAFHVAGVVAGWFPTGDEVAARAATFPNAGGE